MSNYPDNVSVNDPSAPWNQCHEDQDAEEEPECATDDHLWVRVDRFKLVCLTCGAKYYRMWEGKP